MAGELKRVLALSVSKREGGLQCRNRQQTGLCGQVEKSCGCGWHDALQLMWQGDELSIARQAAFCSLNKQPVGRSNG